MSTIKLAAICGVAAEAIFYGVTALFGHAGPCNFNAVIGVTMLFHLPGIIISELLFEGSDAAGAIFIAFSGVVQFFFMAMIAITLWRRVSGRNSPPIILIFIR